MADFEQAIKGTLQHLFEEGFEQLLAEYYDPIRVILGPERVYLLEIFITYFQSQWLENQ
jgi:hypothetical protein